MFFLTTLTLIPELLFLNEKDYKKSSDTGLLSALAISIFLSFIYLYTSKFGNEKLNYSNYISNTIVLAGVFFRTYSKIHLGKYFSHSIRILKNHILIKSGIFSTIRHPAYLGTVLILVGFSSLVSFYFSITTLLISTLAALIRIKHEEDLLTKEFGEEYIDYCSSTYKIFPFII